MIVDQGLGLQYGAVETRHLPRVQFQQQLAASYVTGAAWSADGGTVPVII